MYSVVLLGYYNVVEGIYVVDGNYVQSSVVNCNYVQSTVVTDNLNILLVCGLLSFIIK